MSESELLPLQEITGALAYLARRVAACTADESLEPLDRQTLQQAIQALRRYVPGLDAPPDATTARLSERASAAALDHGDVREALAQALRGLSCAPHNPSLVYLAASACFELGEAELTLRLLYHALWIHPGHQAARADLEALTMFLEDADEEERAA